jgi:superkiller protein 3
MKKKSIKIGRRPLSQPLKVFFIISLVAVAPFILFYLISLAYLLQGDRLLAVGNKEAALSAYQTVLSFNDNSAQAHVKIAQVLQSQKHYSEALEAYKRAFIIDSQPPIEPSQIGDLVVLGDSFAKQENWPDAIDAYQKAIAIKPTFKGQFQLGKALYSLKRWEEAAKAFQEAVFLDPRQGKAYFYLGYAYSEQNLWEEASYAYQQALKLQPHEGETYRKLGEALGKQEKWAEAEQVYRQALIYAPKNGETYNQLGKALAEQRKLEDAIAVFQQAREISPKNARIYENLCYTYINSGQIDTGLKWCRQAVEIDPNLSEARFILQEVQRGRLIHDNPELLKMAESIPSVNRDPLVQLKRSIVKIIIRGRQKNGIGTGWLLKRDQETAWIVTNRHVVANSRQEIDSEARIFVEYYSQPPNGQIRKRSKAKILHTTEPDDWLDLAVLEVKNPPADIRALPLATLPIAPNQPVISIGNPFNQKDWTVSKGTVNNNTEKSLNLSMFVVSGQSGSPVLNDKNQVVGMISQSSLFCANSSTPKPLENAVKLGCGLAMPVERIRERLREWQVIK